MTYTRRMSEASGVAKTPVKNRHGRKPGRGIRPWLLLPKVVCVAMLVGGLAAVAAIVGPPRDWRPGELDAAHAAMSRVFRFVVIPGSIGTVLFGVALLFEHFSVFLRLRWLQVKVALAVIALATLHLAMRHQMHQIQDARSALRVEPVLPHEGLSRGAAALWYTALAGETALLLIVVIGRHKPRLGQNRATLNKPRHAVASNTTNCTASATTEPSEGADRS